MHSRKAAKELPASKSSSRVSSRSLRLRPEVQGFLVSRHKRLPVVVVVVVPVPSIVFIGQKSSSRGRAFGARTS